MSSHPTEQDTRDRQYQLNAEAFSQRGRHKNAYTDGLYAAYLTGARFADAQIPALVEAAVKAERERCALYFQAWTEQRIGEEQTLNEVREILNPSPKEPTNG